jgi:predicted nucleic acid-binding protein
MVTDLIIVDTNVISETMKPFPDPVLFKWYEAHIAEVFITSITTYELLAGVLMLPEGKRKTALLSSIMDSIDKFSDQLLVFDNIAAKESAALKALSRNSGRQAQGEDLMIAGIAKAHNATLATRNTKDFDYLGIRLINPFTS